MLRRSRIVLSFLTYCKSCTNPPIADNNILTSISQHRRHRPRLHRLPPPRHLPRLARRTRPPNRLRSRHQTLPLPTSLASRTRTHLHLLHLRARERTMATHSLRRRRTSGSRFRQWKCQERDWSCCDGVGLVWVCIVDYCHDWTAGYDYEYTSFGQVDG